LSTFSKKKSVNKKEMKMFNVHDQIASQVTSMATIKALWTYFWWPLASSGSRIFSPSHLDLVFRRPQK
jgi:hypothetical protein